MSRKSDSKLVFSTREDAFSSEPAVRLTSVPPQQQTIVVRIERKQRRGKVVTIAQGFQLTPTDLKKLAKTLKKHCGVGGTHKDQSIEVQGEQRDAVIQKLTQLGYKTKRSGG